MDASMLIMQSSGCLGLPKHFNPQDRCSSFPHNPWEALLWSGAVLCSLRAAKYRGRALLPTHGRPFSCGEPKAVSVGLHRA